MLIYKNLIANTKEQLQDQLDVAVAEGWGNPSNPTVSAWEEHMYRDNKIAGTNTYTQFTQVVSKEQI